MSLQVRELHASKAAMWTLFGLFVVVTLYALGIRTLVPPDEGRYAEMAREMFGIDLHAGGVVAGHGLVLLGAGSVQFHGGSDTRFGGSVRTCKKSMWLRPSGCHKAAEIANEKSQAFQIAIWMLNNSIILTNED